MKNNVNRSELIVRLSEKYPQLSASDVDMTVRVILDALAGSLGQGNRIEIRGFGSFSLNQREALVGRNPKTGEPVPVEPKVVLHFKAGKELKERVDSPIHNMGQPKLVVPYPKPEWKPVFHDSERRLHARQEG